MRTWTADIEVYDRKTRLRNTVAATDSWLDLLKDQTETAVEEAWLLGVVNDDYEVVVRLWKHTKARGLEVDRTYRPFLDQRGRLRYGW